MQDVLRRRALGVGIVQIHGVAVKIAPLGLIRMRNNHRKLGNQAHGLAHKVFERGIVRVGVVAIQGQRRACQLVHQVSAGRAHDHVLGEVVGQLACNADGLPEIVELLCSGQFAGEQQERGFAISEAVFGFETVQQVVDINPAIGQAALDWFALALVYQVAVYIAQAGDAGEHAGAVRIPQAALDAVAAEQLGTDVVIWLQIAA